MTTLRRVLHAWLWLLVCAPSAAVAVVIVTGDGSGNDAAPIDDPGFANVGATPSQLSGVYLGDRWVLTAHHVGEEDFRFDGIEYDIVPGSRVQLLTDGVGADLAMLRLQTAPPLPAVTLATEPLAPGVVATFIGSGYPREPDLVCWDGDFVEVSCAETTPPPVHQGYVKQGGVRVIRWGRNAITDVDQQGVLNGRTSRYFTTTFDASGPAHESQAVVGDSGGGVFLKRGGQWELVGIMFAQLVWPNQPPNTAVFGDIGVHADLHFYRQQILDVMDPPPTVPALPLGFVVLAALALALSARMGLRQLAPPLPESGLDG